jgi:hypothetical protein
VSESGRPPGIPDEAWERWTTRTRPGTPGRAGGDAGGAVRRVTVGEGDAANGPCDLCGADTAPFGWLRVDGAPPYVVCATCRATLARLARLTGSGPFQIEA